MNQDSHSPQSNSRRKLLVQAGALAAVAAVPATAVRAQARANQVVFGASLPFTGPYEKVSKIVRDGYDFWTKTVGGKMNVAGKTREVKWVIYDDENNASRSAQLTEKLISDDKVDVLAGGYGTDTVLAQGSIAAKRKMVMIQAGAASGRVDDELGGHTAFTIIGGAKTYHALAVDYVATKSPKPQTAGIIIMDDPVYHEMAAGVRERCAAHGIKVVFEEVLPMNVQDLRPAVLKMKRAGNLDLLVSTGWDVICTKLVEEMSTLGVNPKAFDGGHLTTSPSVKAALGPKMNEILGVNFWMPSLRFKDPIFKSCQEFHDAFLKAYGYAPTYQAVTAYTIPVLYQQVLADADPADPFNQQKIREKLLKLQMETIWGPVAFNERGRIRRAGVPVIQWLGADPAPTIVFPSDLATNPGIYPRKPWA